MCECVRAAFKVCVRSGGVEDMCTLHGAVCMHMHMCSSVQCQRG